MSKQLTTAQTCKSKRTYATNATAKRARVRRNKAAGYKYLTSYRCNVCELWHLTTQEQTKPH